MALEYFPCYHSYRKKIAKLSDEEVGKLFRCLLAYSEYGEVEELDGLVSIAFDFIADDIDRARASYEEKCSKNRANATGRKRSVANGGERSQDKDKDKTKDKDKSESKDETKEECIGCTADKPPRASRFTPPSVEEVKEYCRERGNNVNAQRFVDFYTAKGWKIGKDTMRDWKAAVRTWEKKDGSNDIQTPDKYYYTEDQSL